MKTTYAQLIRIASATFLLSGLLAFTVSEILPLTGTTAVPQPTTTLSTPDPFAGFHAPGLADLFSR